MTASPGKAAGHHEWPLRHQLKSSAFYAFHNGYSKLTNTTQMSEPVFIFNFSIEAMKFVFYFHSKCAPGGSCDTYDEAVPMKVLASKP